MSTQPKLVIYVQLIGEGTTVFRPTTGTIVAGGFVRVEATPNYDPEDEQWEFAPGTIVECEAQIRSGGKVLVGVPRI